MKLSKDEAKAIKFILLVVGLSIIARMTGRQDDAVVQPNTAETFSIPQTDPQSNRPARKSSRATGPLDPNTATRKELEALPGIGPASAKRIIAARPLETLDDLANIIGRTKADALKNRVTLPAREPGSTRTSRPINLNQASPEELESLPGVGPALAQRIIARREQLQFFRTWDQIDSIPGIGPAMLKKLKAGSTF